ncbi:LLM class F420-dependent oxidoreductase [Sphaerisporangium krabiense]|uniref:F420-dependent oxidoreductase-like protein n=1 Tax=Sphaerisporangium krabiense TaxID=763782 RepID=A0A7W8Z9L9_9ACTN|nr:TIGR03564 family F420-dependent LLM class oxidoreductase [Sphaerisporangium krabiense]MBB5630001.1 F420-dependent oxidoreductase-like protein [Sphaerisporangium krabiense]GII64946.1 LLM class F420-dependent oxidoreductase [Sphaerisporangium krabiense]
MKFGVHVGEEGLSLDGLIGQVRTAAEAGLDSVYANQLTSWDAVTLAALAAREVPGIDVGTAVTQTYPRHPLALAGQALTAQAAGRGRFVLGVGPSHQPIIEGWFGYSYARPARHVREYLTALGPLLRGEQVDYRGETLTAAGRVEVPGATPPPVLLSALGPVMLGIAGELTDGVVTTWTTPRTTGEYIVPAVTRAASRAGRPAPRVVTTVIVALTTDPEAAVRRVADVYGMAGNLPSYRALLDRQGLTGVHETVVAGDETTVERALRSYADAGATELLVSPFGDHAHRARVLDLLSALRGRT